MKKPVYALTAIVSLSLFFAVAGFAETKVAADNHLIPAVKQHSYPLHYKNQQFSGSAWDLLLDEAKAAQFFLLGEEHGIAENPKLAASLFKALIPSGYSRLGVEVSPQMATLLDSAARDGLDGLKKLYQNPVTRAVFFGLQEEAEMLVEIRKAAPDKEPVFWGFDYEVLGDRYLLSLLEAGQPPADAVSAIAKLRTASDQSWQTFEQTKNPQYIFSFAGDPKLVETARLAWPNADADMQWAMHSLEETLAINSLWTSGQSWNSNARRVDLLRSNFLKYWRQAEVKPKVFAKMGAGHLIRGRSMTDVFDLGALLPEVAALNDGNSFHLLVLPGKSSDVAMFNPVEMRYQNGPSQGVKGLELLIDNVPSGQFTLIDLRPLRPLVSRDRQGISPELVQTIYGFDAVVIMGGSTAAKNLIPN